MQIFISFRICDPLYQTVIKREKKKEKDKSKEDSELFNLEGKKEISYPPAETLAFSSLLFSIYLNRYI